MIAWSEPSPTPLVLSQAGSGDWDVAIVGAGPAGAASAFLLAGRGHRVLLADRALFPRDKVCGCCLNGTALSVLQTMGLGSLPRQLGAVGLTKLHLACGQATADFALPQGAAISRAALDAALVQAARERGALFISGVSAKLQEGNSGEYRSGILARGGQSVPIRARIILACDGLGGRLLNAPWTVASQSRIGVATILANVPSWYAGGTIHMAVGEGGYVGLVRLEDGRLNIAAALDPIECRRQGGPAALIERFLAQAAFPPIPSLKSAACQGTTLLTRKRRTLGARRVLAVGDACGYVEPFTGEGIAWALLSASAVVDVVEKGLGQWSNRLVDEWAAIQSLLLGQQRSQCRLLARALRIPALTQPAIWLLGHVPPLANRLAAAIGASHHITHIIQSVPRITVSSVSGTPTRQ